MYGCTLHTEHAKIIFEVDQTNEKSCQIKRRKVTNQRNDRSTEAAGLAVFTSCSEGRKFS